MGGAGPGRDWIYLARGLDGVSGTPDATVPGADQSGANNDEELSDLRCIFTGETRCVVCEHTTAGFAFLFWLSDLSRHELHVDGFSQPKHGISIPPVEVVGIPFDCAADRVEAGHGITGARREAEH